MPSPDLEIQLPNRESWYYERSQKRHYARRINRLAVDNVISTKDSKFSFRPCNSPDPPLPYNTCCGQMLASKALCTDYEIHRHANSLLCPVKWKHAWLNPKSNVVIEKLPVVSYTRNSPLLCPQLFFCPDLHESNPCRHTILISDTH